MIVFLYGSDAYRLKQAKEELVSRYKNKYSSGMNLFSVDLTDDTGNDIFENALQSSSFFNEHKLILCKNIFTKKAGAELLKKYLKEYDVAKDADVTLVVAENMNGNDLTIKNKVLFNILDDKKNIVQAIEPLQGEKLFDWIRKEFKTKGCSIEPDALRNLVNTVGTDSWAIINEIDKLVAYEANNITSADVLNLVNTRKDLNIFDLIDALGNKDRKKSFELLYKELKTERDPYYILTMIIYQFRNILTIKDLQKHGLSGPEISRKAKLNPFVVSKTIKSPLETTEAAKIYGNLLALDTGFKMSKLNLENSLYDIALS